MYTTFEIFLANLSFIILLISMLIYWFEASSYNSKSDTLYGALPGMINQSDASANKLESHTKIQNKPLNIFIDWLKRSFNSKTIGSIGMLFSNLSLFMLLLLRWNESGHFPLSNLFESLMFLSWSLTLIHLVITYEGLPQTWTFILEGFRTAGRPAAASHIFHAGSLNSTNWKTMQGSDSEPVLITEPVILKSSISLSPPKQKRKILINKLIGSITAPSALFTNAFATFTLPREMQESSPLVPALQSNWLMMHVTVMILSYAALILGSLLSIGFLVISNGFKVPNLAQIDGNKIRIDNVFLNDGFYSDTNQKKETVWSEANQAMHGQQNLSNIECPLNLNEKTYKYSNNRLNLAKTLDNLSYRILGLGFPLLTIGILSGAVWANEAWGSYWSWDPKETWALLTWLVFAIYLHTRLTKGWEGKKPALIASLGFVTVWICFLGVNLIGEGLHSYGWIS